VTVAPTSPLVGVKVVIVGTSAVTVKLVLLVPVSEPTVTVIDPDVAPDGTVAVIDVEELEVTKAVVLLNLTVLFAGVVLKFVPVITTDVPGDPVEGLNDVIVG